MESKLDRIRGNVKLIEGVTIEDKGPLENDTLAVGPPSRSERAATMKSTLDDAFDAGSRSHAQDHLPPKRGAFQTS